VKHQRVAGILASAFLCTACAVETPKPAPPKLPSAFQQAPAGKNPGSGPTDAAQLGSEIEGSETELLRSFGSEPLNALAARVQSSNFEIVAATARVRQADARARQAGAAILPTLNANGDATEFTGRARGTNGHELDWAALLSASYEVDFWGRNRATARAARALAVASRDGLATVRITALMGLANTYFQLQSLRERMALVRLNVQAAERLLDVVTARYESGRTSAAELAAQRAAVANARLPMAELQQQELEALGAIALLVGEPPEGFEVPEQALQEIQEPVLSPGIPSELLRRRPDIMAAEANLVAAHADLAAARAALFPSLTLTLSGGIQNPAIQAGVLTLPGTGPALNLSGALVQSIFDGGRRRAAIDEARGHEEELLTSYQGTIVAALIDVENALGQRAHLDAQRASQEDNVRQSERTFEAAQLRFREGSGQFLAVLDAQRVLYAAREQATQYRLSRLQAILGLSKALGGGWQQRGAPAPPTADVVSLRGDLPHE